MKDHIKLRLILQQIKVTISRIIVGLLNGTIKVCFSDRYFIYEDHSESDSTIIKIPLRFIFKQPQPTPVTP